MRAQLVIKTPRWIKPSAVICILGAIALSVVAGSTIGAVAMLLNTIGLSFEIYTARMHAQTYRDAAEKLIEQPIARAFETNKALFTPKPQ